MVGRSMNRGFFTTIYFFTVIQIYFANAAGIAVTADVIPPAPNIQEFRFDRGSLFDCGVKFYMHKGQETIVALMTEDGKTFGIFSSSDKSFQAWIDFDYDGIFDQYFEGIEGLKNVKKLYPNPCDILKENHFL